MNKLNLKKLKKSIPDIVKDQVLYLSQHEVRQIPNIVIQQVQMPEKGKEDICPNNTILTKLLQISLLQRHMQKLLL